MITTLDDAIFSSILIMGIVSMTVVFFMFMYMIFEFFILGWSIVRLRLRKQDIESDTEKWMASVKLHTDFESRRDLMLSIIVYKRLSGTGRGFNTGAELAGILDIMEISSSSDTSANNISVNEIRTLFNIPTDGLTNSVLFQLYCDAVSTLDDYGLKSEEDRLKLSAIYGSFMTSE